MAVKKKKPRELKVDPEATTLAQAKIAMGEVVKGGRAVICPCCKQEVRLYQRTISPASAMSLIVLYSYFKNSSEWLNVPRYLNDMAKVGSSAQVADVVKLLHWGLIEKKPASKTDAGPRAGYYRMTDLGHKFVRGEATVSKIAKVYNKRLLGLSGDPVSIQECLGTEFDYDKLMSGEFGTFFA